jgi:hypothetical protein
VPRAQRRRSARVRNPELVSFTQETEYEAGTFNTPAKPQIGFLLNYIEVAVNLDGKLVAEG